MATTKEWIKAIGQGDLNGRISSLYGFDALLGEKERYKAALSAFEKLYGAKEVRIFSVPGRSEIAGNHTDHNHGKVVAAAVCRDIIAVVAEREDDEIHVKSEGFPEDSVLCCEEEPDPAQFFTSASLIRGVCRGMRKQGFAVCGFDAYTTSDVMKGSGLSSSAAFEVMIAKIESALANGDSVKAPLLAKISQYAENVWFGKPSGLMDQTACAVGGFITIDFADPENAKITPVPFQLSQNGYTLCITDTGGNHADLNEDYASVPAEMKAVAHAFGRETLRGVTAEEILSRIPALRAETGDRAILRALHFVNENDRVDALVSALKKNDMPAFLDVISESGRSSFMYLQNVWTTKNVREQGLSLALAVSGQLLAGKKAAFRVHGGGFAGTVQAFVPKADTPSYKAAMDAVFGKNACSVLTVRGEGASEI